LALSNPGATSSKGTGLNDPSEIKQNNNKNPDSDLKGKSWANLKNLERKSPRAVALSSDGKTLALCDTNLGLYDAKTGNEKAILEEKAPPGSELAISSDGKYLAFSADMRSKIKLWNIENGKLEKEIDNPYVGIPTVPLPGGAKTFVMRCSMGFSYDNKYLITAGHSQKNKSASKKKEANDELIFVWNMENLKQETRLQGEEPISCANKSPFIAYRGKNPSEAFVWNVETKQQVAKIDAQASGTVLGKQTSLTKIESLSLSPDGKLLAVLVKIGDDGTRILNYPNQVQLWDIATKTKQDLSFGLGDNLNAISQIKFFPNEPILAVAGEMKVTGTSKKIGLIQLFDIKTNKFASLLGHQKKVKSISISPDGKHLASISEYSGNETKLWNEQPNEKGLFHFVDATDEKSMLSQLTDDYRTQETAIKETAKQNQESQELARLNEMRSKYGKNPKGFTRKILVAPSDLLKNYAYNTGGNINLKGAVANYEPESVGDLLQAISLFVGKNLQGSRLKEIGNDFSSPGPINTPFATWVAIFGLPDNNKKWSINCTDGVVRFVGIAVPRDNSLTKALVVVYNVHWGNFIKEFCLSK